MTDKIEETTLEGVDLFFTKITEAGEVIADKLIEVSPDVAEGLLTLVQYKGGFDLLIATLYLIVFTIATKKIWTWGMKKPDPQCYYRNFKNLEEGIVPLSVVWSFFFVLGVAALYDLFHFYNWVALFYPEGAVAIKALEAVGITL